jgi:hypothetical protein
VLGRNREERGEPRKQGYEPQGEQEFGGEVRINITLTGDPARWYKERRRRGLVRNTRDAVVQALVALQERVLELDQEELRGERGG